MKPIGGYFELETARGPHSPHPNARLALKSGRACVRLLAEWCRPARVWVPYYACSSLTEPLTALEIEVRYYAVNARLELDPPWPELKEADRLVYVNYFGLKTDFAQQLEQTYGAQLWVDNTQAFFYEPAAPRAFHFNSARKYFGVPDGAYLYCPASTHLPPTEQFSRNTAYVFEHLMLRHLGKVGEGYPFFQQSNRVAGGPVARMSELSESVLSHVDYPAAARRRRENYQYLHERLGASNQLTPHITTLAAAAVPLCYPYLPPYPMQKQAFWDAAIFIPTLWPECMSRPSEQFPWERTLSAELLPLPVDHRYGLRDMERIAQAIEQYEF